MKSEAPVLAMQLRGSPVVICLLLCAASVHANHLVHESTATAFLVNQQDAKDGLDDDKMADLTGSIEGLFDDNSEAPAKDAKKVATAAPAAKAKPNPPAKVVQAAVKAAAKIPSKVVANVAKPKAVPVAAKVVKAKAVAAVAKPVQKKAEKKPVPTKQATEKKVSPAPVAAKVVAKAPQPKVAKVASKPAHAEVAKLAAKPSQPKVVAAKPSKPKAALVAAKPVTKAASKRVETKVAKAAAAKPTPPKVAKKVATPEKPKVVKMAAKATQPKVVAATSKPKVAAKATQPKVVAAKSAKPVAKVAAKPVAKVALIAAKPVAKVAAKSVQPKVAEAAAKPVQPKVAKVVAKPTQPKVTKMAAKPVEPKVVKMAAKPAQPKVVTKVAAKTAQPKVAAAAAAKPSQPKATKVVAKPAQPEVVKMAAKTTQPKATKVVAKPAQPEVVKMAAKTTQPKATKAVAKPAQSKVAEVAKVVAKPAQPKATKVAAKPAQPKVVKMVAKPAQPKVATVVAKPPQPKATKAKPSQPKAAKVITKPSQPEVVKAVSKKPKVEAKPTAKVAPAPVAKVVKVGKSMKKPEQLKAIPPLAKVQVAAKPLSKLAVAKVLSNNSDVHVVVANTSKSASQPANTTKVIEEAVVSLPMASFALDIAGPDANKTKVAEHKFPGNASQKAAWDKKEEALEHEVQRLKMRLAKVNATPAKLAAKVPPAATGTFNSNVGVKTEQKDKKAAPMNKSTEPTRTAPMEPIRKEKIPKAAWPTMQSVAAPVALHHVNSPVVPPQKEAIEAQQGKKTVAMGSTFTGTPSKKVESIMALDTEVVHDAVMTDVVQEDARETLSWWQQGQDWVSSIGDFIGRKMGLQSAAAVPKKAHKSHHAAASLLDMTQRGLKQDMERTEQATKDEGEHIVALGSVWGQMEEEDKTQVQQVKSEDESERQRASFREAPHTPTKAELQGRHGHDMSSFWGSLEQLDSDLQKAESTENLGEYQRLTGVQNWLVTKASNQLKQTGLHMERDETLKHNDQAFLSKTIHDPWESLEKKDKAVETQIHDSPDLQMLQLKHSSHPYK